MVDQSLHWVVAHRATGDEPLFVGVPMAPGVHLRWSIRPDLGFPKYGFAIERCFTEFCEFSTYGHRWASPWVKVAHVTLPTLDENGRPVSDALGETVGRLRAHPDGWRIAERYTREAPHLIEVLRTAVRPTEPQQLGGDNIKLRSTGLLALAALDPFIARMVGLYWIDGTVPPATPVAYRVTALWDGERIVGDRGVVSPRESRVLGQPVRIVQPLQIQRDPHEWPWHRVDLQRASSREIAEGTITTSGTTLRSMRKLVLFRDDTPRLELTGTAELALHIELPIAVRAVRVAIDAGPDAGSWSAVVRSGRSDTASVLLASTLSVESGALVIRADRAFDLIELRRSGPGVTTWRLSELSWREREGSIGRVAAYCTVGDGPVNPPTGPCADPPELSTAGTVSRFPDGHMLAPPTGLRLEQRSMPPIILEDGSVPGTASHVAVYCRGGAAASDPRRAVRLEARRGSARVVLPRPVIDLPRFGRITLPQILLPKVPSLSLVPGSALRLTASQLETRIVGKVTRRARAGVEPEHIAFDQGAAEVAIPGPADEPIEVFTWVRTSGPAAEQTVLALHDDVWLGLVGKEAIPTLRIGKLELRASVNAQTTGWRHVGLTLTKSTAQLWVDGAIAAEAKLAREVAIPSTLRLGAVASSKYLRGALADLIIRRGNSVPQASDMITPHPVIYRDAPADRPQLMDPWVPDGSYRCEVRGVDLFGRVSEYTSASLEVADREPPPAPLVVEASLVPATGTITNVRVVGDATWLDTGVVFDASAARALTRHAVRAQRSVDGRAWAELLEIVGASVDGEGRLSVQVTGPGVLRLRPRTGDAIRLEIDRVVDVSWTWTGRQAFFHPRAREHRLYRDDRLLNVVEATVETATRVDDSRWDIAVRCESVVAATELDALVEIDGRLYQNTGTDRIAGATAVLRVQYLARPAIAPAPRERVLLRVRRDTSGWRDLRDASVWRERVATHEVSGHAPVDWPAARSTPLAKDATSLSAIGAPSLAKIDGGLHTLVLPARRERVSASGAVRARIAGRWVVFDVVHEQPRTSDTLLVLLVPADVADASASLDMRDLRYVPGRRYTARLNIDPSVATEHGTAPVRFGVTTTDTRGNESAVSRPARVVVVDRRLPLAAPQPVVRIGRIDYHRVATAQVSWSASPEPCAYQLYRATDAAVFLRDCELRRKRRGHYAPASIADVRDVVLRDDPDFQDWLRARFPELAERWPTALFVDERSDAAGWQKASEVWRAFSQRYHRALTAAQIAEHASRAGMDDCFGLVTQAPVDGTSHPDPIPAGGSNPFLYRLRCVTPAQVRGLALGPASMPAAPESVRRPSAPVILGASSGDRQISVRWAVQAAADVRRYDVYRADTADPLHDLRWTDTDPRVRRIASVTDPRLIVRDRSLVVPAALGLRTVLAVHRADEHDRTRDPDDQPRAFNYASAATRTVESADTARIEGLRPIEDGVAVVVVGRDAAGVVMRLDRVTPDVLVVEAGNDHVRCSPIHPVATLLGVFQRGAFDPTRPVEDQAAANLAAADATVLADDSAIRVGPVVMADHRREVVIVYRDATDRMRVVEADERWPVEATIVDRGLVAFRDYFYAVVAIDRDGTPSIPSLAVQARAIDRHPPVPPRWDEASWVSTDEPRVALAWSVDQEGTRCLLMRRTRPHDRFRPISPWLTTAVAAGGRWTFAFEDRSADPATGHVYAVMVVSASGNQSVELTPQTVGPR